MNTSVIGKPIPQLDGVEKATGTASYLADLHFSRQLFGKILRSPLPHAKILNIDTSKAKKVIGVRAVVTGEDTPKKLYGFIVADEPALAFDRVRYVGDEMAAVAAETEEAAEEALELIDVDYEELPALFDPEEALEETAPKIHAKGNLAYRFNYSRGDVAKALEDSDVVFESCYRTPRVHQVYMEPRGCVAWASPAGEVTIWGGFSMVFPIRERVSSTLNLDPGKVRVIQTSTGGSFGGKGASSKAPICALLALKTGRTVKIVNTWEEEFSAGRPRVPGIIRQKIGVKRDGTLVARKVKVVCDCGAYAGITPHIAETMTMRAENIYRFSSLEGEGLVAYTNLTPTGPHRAFGDPPGLFALETQLDEIARALSMDPLELRLKNIVCANQVTGHGWQITSCGLEDCLKQVAQRVGWQDKRSKRPPGYGIGVACGIQISGTRRSRDYDGASALIKIDPSGQVTLLIGESDVGQGAKTVLAQIAAEELGISMSRIRVVLADTELTPYGVGAIASRVTVIGGNAVKAAASDARGQLLGPAAEILEANPGDLVTAQDKIFVKGSPDRAITFPQACSRAVYRPGGGPILGRGTYDPPTVVPDETVYGNYSIAYPFCAQVAEVEVDGETGEVKLLAFYSTEDVGRIINPLAQEGQVQGCLSQARGLASCEEIVQEKGKVVNGSFMDYKIPCALDLPPLSLSFADTYDPNGPFGAKSGGEGAIAPLPAAIANAILHAVGVKARSLPITAEKVFQAVKGQASGPGDSSLSSC